MTDAAQELGLGCVAFDRVRPLMDGRVEIPGYRLHLPKLSSIEIFRASLQRSELTAAEVSPGFFAAHLDAGGTNYTGLPIPIVRAFRHGSIFVRADGPVGDPSRLNGARIGIPEMLGTTCIWQKGLLQDEYGIDLKSVTWVAGGVDDATPGFSTPADSQHDTFRIELAGERKLADMLLAGELDAILALRPPQAFKAGAGIVRLFPDYVGREQDYYRRTGIFPVLHMVVARNSDIAADPELHHKLVTAFTAAKDIALKEVEETMYYYATVPFLPLAVEESRALFGADFWPYGMDSMRVAMETFLRYCHEQKLTTRQQTLDELFPLFA